MDTLLLTLLLAACSGEGDAPGVKAGGPPPTPVKVAVVEGVRASDQLEAVGVLEVLDSVQVQPEAAGVVEAVLFDDGAAVAKGQRLATLRAADARAGVDEAAAKYGLAKLAYDRIASLREGDNATQADVDKARAELDLAQAQVDRSREALRRTVIVAPFAGVAGRREIAPGQVVTTSTPVTRIDALDPVLVDVDLPETALTKVRAGLAAAVAVEAVPGRSFEGEVSYVSPRASEKARTLEVRVRVPNPEGLLRPGLSASVRLDLGEVDGAVFVPTSAVVQTASGPAAWVVDGDGKAQPRPLTLGLREEERVRVLQGLAVGDRLVVEGFTRLKPGAPVAVQEPGAGAEAGAPAGGAAAGGKPAP